MGISLVGDAHFFVIKLAKYPYFAYNATMVS